MCECGTIGQDDFLGEYGDDGIGKFWRAVFPDVGAAVWGGGYASELLGLEV